MKVASFIHHYEFDVPGNVYKNAVVLGDVDNDNDIELVVGNVDGDLYIFKGQRQIQKISGLGIITAIAIGDLMNCGSNTLIVISGDGWCHIYLCLKLCKSELVDECIVKLEPVHVQRIPANTKVNSTRFYVVKMYMCFICISLLSVSVFLGSFTGRRRR